MVRKGRLTALSAAFIFSVIFVISLCVGCDLWMNDWKGYLEYWSETLQMGRVEVTGATIQKNDSGVDTISLSATPTITSYIINPKDYNLNKTVGNDSSSTNSVRISSGVDGLASVTGDNTMMAVRLASASGKIEEHTDFTVTFVPVRTDTGVESSSRMSVTLQYNTPPRAPLALMWDSSNSAFVQLQSQAWQPTTGTGTDKDGYIYWGWPEDSYVGSNSFDETAADCVAQFSINGTLHDASNLLVKDSNGSVESFISGSAPYDVYGLQVGSGISVSLFAQDSEGIAGTSLRSGVAPYTITLLGNGGQYNGADTHQLYLQGGSTITKDDLAIFQKQGYKISGWCDSNGAISFPYTVKNDVTLYAQWDANKYSVQFYPNGGSGDLPTRTFTYDTAENLPSNQFSKSGYTFVGWATSSTGSVVYPDGSSILNLTAVNGGMVSLYAIWGNSVTDFTNLQNLVNSAPSSGDPVTIVLTGDLTFTNATSNTYALTIQNGANVTLQGDGQKRIIKGSSTGWIEVREGTLTLGPNLVIDGDNASSHWGAISVEYRGTLIMEDGAEIINMTSGGSNCSAVRLTNFVSSIGNPAYGGTFIMNGGRIENNDGPGAAVAVGGGSTFIMSGGQIVGNTTYSTVDSGGVNVDQGGEFTMNGGTITGNYKDGSTKTPSDVTVESGGTFVQNGGTIGQPVEYINP